MSLGLVYVGTATLNTTDADSFVKGNNLFSHPSSISWDHNGRSVVCLLHRRNMGQVRLALVTQHTILVSR